MNTPDLETQLRSYYERFAPGDSVRLAVASARLLDDARRPQPRRALWGTWRVAATLAVALLLLAVLLPRFGAGGPGVGARTSTPGPTFNLAGALKAQVDEAGLMRSGGMWAVEGSYLLTSVDNGATWRAGTFPGPGGPVAVEDVFVLDQDHAWAIASNGLNGAVASPAVAGQLLTVNRTVDGGRTWHSTVITGDYGCQSASLSFVDAQHGFLVCVVPSTPGPDGPLAQSLLHAKQGSGTILRTDDGGVTWSVAGSAAGLGAGFTASDARTLWSVPDSISSELTGTYLYVSRDGGVTWAAVSLPGLGSFGPNTQVGSATGPVFWDGSNGALAVSVWPCCSSTSAEMWFYRTGDGGLSWSVFKEPKQPFGGFQVNALAGRVWAVVGDSGLWSINVSSDFGSSWTVVPGYGMPDNTSFLTLDLADKDHGLATVFGVQGTRTLQLTSDGGRTWHPADFGDARARVSSTAADPVAAKNLADEFEMMAVKDPPTSWNMLSAFSQKAFGSESAFASARTALAARTNYTYEVGSPTQSASLLSESTVGPEAWADLTASADISRAYAVAVTFPGTSEPAETIVVAPLSTTGDWRVWLMPTP